MTAAGPEAMRLHADLARAGWRPSPGWASTVEPAYRALAAGATGLEAASAWAELAMMLGDTGAPGLGLLAVLHAEAGLPDGVEDRRLAAHRDLFLLDLGLGATAAPGAIPLAKLGEPGFVAVAHPRLAGWLADELARFGGSLERAARFALRLAAVRTGVVTVAIVRGVSAGFARAIAAAPPDPPLDVARARAQHAGYVEALRRAGAEIVAIDGDDGLPDCCFVEDTAVIAGGVALLARPGAPARRPEPAAVRPALEALLPVEEMVAPATLDGGDCLRLGRRLYVGRSARTNAEGAAHARAWFGAAGVEVIEVPVAGALHLKSVCSPLGPDAVLVAEGALPPGTFAGAREVIVPTAEAHAANVVTLGGAALVAAGAPATARLVAAAGFQPVPVDTSELRRADGALTCLSILVGL